jgi:class 3 adenylate cyclase/predicted ATPase
MTNVQEWLDSLGLGQYAAAFVENCIEWEHLPDLDHEVLQSIGVKAAGHRMTILKAIANLDVDTDATPTQQRKTPSPAAQSTPTGEAERRQLTVMFCDLVGSTALSAKLDPEDLREVITSFQDQCREAIEQYAGFIARYMGDGMLVYFGYPQAHEDDAERAARAGLDIVRSMAELNTEFGRLHEVVLAVRVGVATGAVVVGDIVGEGAAEEAAVVGETPNLAARLQGLAEPNTVVIAEPTRQLIEGLFDCAEQGVHRLKGFDRPVQVWRVVSEREVESRYEAKRVGGRLPLVGRQEELGLLVRSWEAAKERHGQVVLIQGEAGIGKSRLLDALRERISGQHYLWVVHRCSPYHANSTLYPVIEHLKRALGWKPESGTVEKLKKLEAALREQSLRLEEAVPLYAELMSLPLPEGRYEPLNLNPKQKREATLDAIAGRLLEMAERTPVLQVWEDLHWADPTTLELLGLCLEQSPTVSMLNVVTYRPEFVPPWAMRSHMTPITLNRLERPEVEALIGHQANGKTVPSEVLEHIVEKADGVPLYVEELTKTILESDYLHEEAERYTLAGSLSEVAIPATLQDSLMARLDRAPTIREVAQLGAVLGREFTYEMLRYLAPLEEPVLQKGLGQLVENELLYQRGRPPRSRYIFKHALIQDAAYQSLLKRTRQQYHRNVAELLEERFPETVEAQPELLAHHYTEAADPARAVAFWQRAGERARAQFANWEAMGHLSRGIAVLEQLTDDDERRRKELALQLSLGHATSVARGKGGREVEMAYERARTLCQQLGDAADLVPALFGLWRFYLVNRPLGDALDLAMQLLRLADEQSNAVNYVIAHYAVGVTHMVMGHLAEGEADLERAVTEYAPEQRRADVYHAAQDPGTACLVYSAMGKWLLGYPDRARERMRESVSRAEELADAVSLGHALCFSTIVTEMCGDDGETEVMAEREIALATEKGFSAWIAFGRVSRSWVAFKSGQEASALEELRNSIVLRMDLGMEYFVPFFMTLLAQAYWRVGQVDEGLKTLGRAQAVIGVRSERWWEADVHRLRGELLLSESSDNADEAKVCFEQALEVSRNQEAKSLELRAAMSLARLWRQQGKRDEALDLLKPIYDWFTEGFDTLDLREAKSLLVKLS